MRRTAPSEASRPPGGDDGQAFVRRDGAAGPRPPMTEALETPAAGGSGRLPWSVRVGYGGAEMLGTATWTVFYSFFLYYLTDYVGLRAALAGLLITLGTVVQAVVAPYSGVVSDAVTWKSGRRRPFLLLSGIPLVVTFWLLFADVGLSGAWLFVYLAVAATLFNSAWSFEQTPYTALAAEMTLDYDERTNLVSGRSVWSILATLVGMAFPLLLVGWLGGWAGSERAGWSLMALAIGLAGLPCLLLTWWVTRGRELHPSQRTGLSPRDIWDSLRHNRTFAWVTGVYTWAMAAQNVMSLMVVYFTVHWMRWSEQRTSMFFLMTALAGLVWIPVINRSAVWFGKRRAMLFWNLWGALFYGVGMMLIRPGDATLFWVLGAFGVAGLVAGMVLTWAMIPDCTEVDELRTGARREGLYYGVATFVQQLALALVLWAVSAGLTWSGYVSGEGAGAQPDGALLGIRLLTGLGTALCCVLTLVFTYKMPMTAARHAALRAAIEAKARGEEVDLGEFADVM